MTPLAAPLRALTRVARHLPLPLALSLVARLRHPYAALARASGYRLPPRDLARYPAQLRGLLGREAWPADPSALMADRLAYVLSYWLIASRIERESAEAARALLSRVEIRGADHLRAALARGRGAVALTAHFGFPHLARTVLSRLGVSAVAGTSWQRHAGQILSTGDVWTRARSAQRMEAALARRQVCVMLADGPAARAMRLGFLHGHVNVAAGPFHLANRMAAPIVPFFIVAPDEPTAFDVAFEPPLSSGVAPEPAAFADAAQELLELYAALARRHPSHLQFGFIDGT